MEYIRFGEWPLQILTDANTLIAEAIREAEAVEFGGTSTRVFRAEHLCAIALQAGRRKHTLRVSMFLEQGRVDVEALHSLAKRYNLAMQLEQVLGETGGGHVGDR